MWNEAVSSSLLFTSHATPPKLIIWLNRSPWLGFSQADQSLFNPALLHSPPLKKRLVPKSCPQVRTKKKTTAKTRTLNQASFPKSESKSQDHKACNTTTVHLLHAAKRKHMLHITHSQTQTSWNSKGNRISNSCQAFMTWSQSNPDWTSLKHSLLLAAPQRHQHHTYYPK